MEDIEDDCVPLSFKEFFSWRLVVVFLESLVFYTCLVLKVFHVIKIEWKLFVSIAILVLVVNAVVLTIIDEAKGKFFEKK